MIKWFFTNVGWKLRFHVPFSNSLFFLHLQNQNFQILMQFSSYNMQLLQKQVWPSLHGYLKRGSHPSTFLPSPFSFVLFRQDTRHSQHAQVGKAPWGKLLRSKFECNCHFVYRVSSLHHSNSKSLIFTVYSCPLRKKFLGVSREKRVTPEAKGMT